MKKFGWLVAMSMMMTSWAIAQENYVLNGTVIAEEDGEGLPGVSILIKGTTSGTVSDFNGEYSIEVDGTETLVFSYVGYETQEILIGSRRLIDISLEQDIESLSEVVVIGYGSVQKRELTGSVYQISADEFEQRNVATLTEALAGTIPGVQVSSFSGAPGAGAFISIRGISTINDNGVLYVVDGIPLRAIDFLNPQDIASVQILKDASAAAIYGSQGANGVVIIETKRAKKGQLVVEFSSKYGIQSVANAPNMADATEYAKIQNQKIINEGGATLPYPNPDQFGVGTDWWSEASQTAIISDYHLSASKGGEDYSISTSASYFDQEGVLKGGGYKRATFRVNSEVKLAEWLTLGENFTFSNQDRINGLDDYLVWDVMRLEPITPVYLPGYEISNQNEFSIFSPTITDVGNAVGQLARRFNTSRSMRTVGNIFLEAKPIESLQIRSEFGVEMENWESDWFSPDYYIEETDKNDINSVGRNFGTKFLYNWNSIVTYSKSISNHNIKIMGAMTARSDRWKTISASGKNTPSNHPDLRYVEATTSAWQAGGSDFEITYLSYLGRVNYDFKGKYLFTGSLRADGSSKFPTSSKWGVFPSASAGWILSDESFLNDIDWLSLLKVRAAWGQIGNDNINQNARIAYIDNYYYITGDSQELRLGKAPSQVGNNNLKWETVEDLNIGLDAEFFHGKINFNFDAYKRQSKDMLMDKALLSYFGMGFVRQTANIGSMSTTGLEFQVTHQNVIGDFNYSAGVNVTHSNSTMEVLADGEAIWEGNDQRLGLLTQTVEGGSVGAFYGYVTDGIFQSQIEVNNYSDNSGNVIQPSAGPGDFRFKDINGDGALTADDRTVIGDPEALFSYGMNMNAGYKGFDIRLLFTGTYGNDLLTPILAYTHSGSGDYNSYAGLLNDAWNGEGSSNTQPRLARIDPNQNFRYSDYYISDGSYLRLKNVQVGYSLPSQLISKLGIDKIRASISAENVFTLTAYEGLDPDVGPYYSNALLRGVNWGNYPLPRLVSFGLSATF